MKLFTTTALLLLLSTTTFAASKRDMAQDMRTMLSAMQAIESAGFYSNKSGMKAGINDLKSSLESLKTTDAKTYLPKDKAYANKFAKKMASMIELYADDMYESLSENRMEDALQNYSLILRQCTSCHIRMRSY